MLITNKVEAVNICIKSSPFHQYYEIFLFKIIFFKLEDNCFILYQYLPNINRNKPQAYIYPLPLKSPSLLPLHHTPLGCHRALGLSSLHGTANSHWLSILHMVMYMYMLLLYSSQPLLPLLCPQICSLCLCLQCCSANRFISTIFLDSTYMC